MTSSSSGVNGMSNIHLSKRLKTEDKTRSLMLDLDFLDCPICVEPFTIPIFQCDNGHLACASCLPKLSNKCPSCGFPVGHSRCRAMENVLESIFVPCTNAKLGCTKKVSYGKESTHENECIFTRCSCPLKDCFYSGPYDTMFRHFTAVHSNRYMLFCCDKFFDFRMNISDKMLTGIEYMVNRLFVVQCFREPYAVYVTISCIAPSTPEVGEFSSHLTYTVDGNTMAYESEVKRILKVSSQRPEESFMLIPDNFLRGDSLKMKLCINKLKRQ